MTTQRKPRASKSLAVFDVALDKVVPYDRNPRNNEAAVDKVCESIQKFGFRQPIVVDGDFVIIAGHTRWQAANKLKLKSVPVHVADITESQAKEYRLADNKTAEYSTWDFDALAVELAELEQMDVETDWLEFELPDEPAPDNANEIEANEIDEAVPDLKSESISEPGQLIKLGRHRLMCADSGNGDAWDALMQGEKANLLLTDPPYGVAYVGKTEKALTIENDEMHGEDFRQWLNVPFANAFSVMAPGSSYYIWHAHTESYAFQGMLLDNGVDLRQCLVWVKDTMVMGRQDYQWQHEPCLYGWTAGEAHTWNSDRSQVTTLRFDRPTRSTQHPTMKPTELFSYLMHNSSDAGQIVVDPFLGSGTTLLSAERLGRTCYGIELDPKYCDVIVERWENYTGQKAERTECL